MKDKMLNDFRKLSLDDKKEVILNEIYDNIQVIERLCVKKCIEYNKVNKNDTLVDKTCLNDNDFLDLLYEYNLVLRENSSALLVDLLK